MIKLIATDMDHTLLDDDSNLPCNFEEVLAELKNNNIHMVLASGRTLFSIKKKAHDYIDDLSFVSDNGAIVEHQGKILYQSVFSKRDIKIVTEVFRQCKETSIIASGINCAYVELGDPVHEQYLEEYYPGFVIVDDLTDVDLNFVKITACSLHHTVSNFQEIVQSALNGTFNAVTAGAVWIDVMNSDVNKGQGIQHLLQTLNIDAADIVTFGDYHNDIQMLKLAGRSYAVSNAHEDVKRIVTEVIDSNNNNAVMNQIQKLITK
ncbi:HAD family phosphatase [Erysipelothrix piscisicarius]|uniref:HAD family phosphatase n=1 Tax=Erysipelothrix piscisicarius TaxID=2485784 RepID=A0A3S8RL55_9FIRM|nr:HAD family hydrolase [Erysipelothrix piscisicarius]AZK43654.1 HAD family phosphatase [Erysipelothrix piscisicarius]